MNRALRWLSQFLKESLCPHNWGPVLEAHHKGYGVAEIICRTCGKREVYEYWYGEDDDPEHDSNQ